MTASSDGSLTILGGGPAGLGVGFYAARAGLPFALYEKSPHFGGICRTFQQGAHRYDCGAHRFHDRDPDITADVRELLGDDLRRVVAPNQVWDGGRFLDFPPTPLGLLRSCGLREAGRIGLELARERLRSRPNRVARGLRGEPLRRDPRPPDPAELLREALGPARRGALTRRGHPSPEGAEPVLPGGGGDVLALARAGHLDGSFLYPRQGYGRICEALEQSLPAKALRPQREVVRLECSRGRVTRIEFAQRRGRRSARPNPVDPAAHRPREPPG